MTGFILASQSSSRRRMMAAAGLAFDVMPAAIDETGLIEAMLAEGQAGRNIADCLAEMKALRVSGTHEEAWVVGGDQVLMLGSELFEKPGSLAEAREHLRRLRGKTHVLYSAACAARGGSVVWRHVAEARMTMRPFSDSFLDRYLEVAGADILGSVGAYHVEGLGVQLFSRIEGDLFTVQGFPLLPFMDFLRVQGLVQS
jgi:septum formation protein